MTAPTSAQVAAARRVLANDPFLTVADIAKDLRVSKMSVYRATSGEFLRSIRVGRQLRIRTSWFQEWLDAGAPTLGDDQ